MEKEHDINLVCCVRISHLKKKKNPKNVNGDLKTLIRTIMMECSKYLPIGWNLKYIPVEYGTYKLISS